MIGEHAVPPLKPGSEDDFVEAFETAKGIVASMREFRRVERVLEA